VPPGGDPVRMLAANVTFVFPLAIAVPPVPVFFVIVEASRLSVPRFESPPPKLPDVLPAIVELLILVVPPGWTLIPPPLIGALLLTNAERSIEAVPLLRIAPPPTPVVVLPANVEFSINRALPPHGPGKSSEAYLSPCRCRGG
jgi:hypothetical protein